MGVSSLGSAALIAVLKITQTSFFIGLLKLIFCFFSGSQVFDPRFQWWDSSRANAWNGIAHYSSDKCAEFISQYIKKSTICHKQWWTRRHRQWWNWQQLFSSGKIKCVVWATRLWNSKHLGKYIQSSSTYLNINVCPHCVCHMGEPILSRFVIPFNGFLMFCFS